MTPLPRLDALRRALASTETKTAPMVRSRPSLSQTLPAPSDIDPHPQDVADEGLSGQAAQESEKDGEWEKDSAGATELPVHSIDVNGSRAILPLICE
jgi:hypothetical protein